MRTLILSLVLVLFAGFATLAASGTQPTAKTAPAKRTAPARRPATAAPAKLKPTLVAPTTDIFHEHYKVRIVGTVSDANGQPLPGASIWVTNRREVLAVTNAEGDFVLTLPTNAPITLSCGFAGLQDERVVLAQPVRYMQVLFSLQSERTVASK